MVLDSSVLLAVFFAEEHGEWAVDQLEQHTAELHMSTVNAAEVLIQLQDRQPRLFDNLKERLLTSGIRFVSPDIRQAELAAAARLRFPLNLGDCFAYALAVVRGDAILTLDEDFRAIDQPVVLPPRQA